MFLLKRCWCALQLGITLCHPGVKCQATIPHFSPFFKAFFPCSCRVYPCQEITDKISREHRVKQGSQPPVQTAAASATGEFEKRHSSLPPLKNKISSRGNLLRFSFLFLLSSKGPRTLNQHVPCTASDIYDSHSVCGTSNDTDSHSHTVIIDRGSNFVIGGILDVIYHY